VDLNYDPRPFTTNDGAVQTKTPVIRGFKSLKPAPAFYNRDAGTGLFIVGEYQPISIDPIEKTLMQEGRKVRKRPGKKEKWQGPSDIQEMGSSKSQASLFLKDAAEQENQGEAPNFMTLKIMKKTEKRPLLPSKTIMEETRGSSVNLEIGQAQFRSKENPKRTGHLKKESLSILPILNSQNVKSSKVLSPLPKREFIVSEENGKNHSINMIGSDVRRSVAAERYKSQDEEERENDPLDDSDVLVFRDQDGDF
jgi:hypothetical protein